MQSQPTRSQLSSPALAFARDEWELLLTLPRRVLVAATCAGADPDRRTVAAGIAGMEALAAGRASTSPLVREVVATVYAERHRDAPAPAGYTDPRAGIHATLVACQSASRLLAGRATSADADAYRRWLTAIARAVCEAAEAGGARAGVAGGHFLDEVQGVLGT